MRTEKKEGTIAIELDFSPILSIKEKQQRDAPSAAAAAASLLRFSLFEDE